MNPETLPEEKGDNSLENTFFCLEGVKGRKCEAIKNRLRALILERGMSEPEFFNSLGISRQLWYSISWGLHNVPPDTKIKISKALGVDSRVIWEMKE